MEDELIQEQKTLKSDIAILEDELTWRKQRLLEINRPMHIDAREVIKTLNEREAASRTARFKVEKEYNPDLVTGVWIDE